jgi:predicted metalloprotease with PDZ domain
MLALLMLAAVATAPAADYQVRLDGDSGVLHVEASVPGGGPWHVDEGLGAYLEGVSVEARTGWARVDVRGDTVTPPDCGHVCRVRYRVRLREAAEALKDRGRALAQSGLILAPPSAWLLHPRPADPAARFRLRAAVPAGARFVTGLFPAPGTPDVYEGALADLPSSPYSAFGALRTETLGPVELAVPAEAALPPREVLRTWVERSVAAVSGYYGRFPVPRVLVLLLPGARRAVGFGTTMGNGGASIMAWVRPTATAQDLRADWVLTHEMVHLAFPNVARSHLWLEEGIASYVEPLARVRAGQLAAEEAWRSMVKGLPNGLPREGDRGLDHTHTWGRTYWGGALFCLLADLEIRERTGNRRSLEDALRGIQAAGGSIAVRWDLSRALEAGDRATGVPVLQELHRRMGGAPVPVDLPALWKRLGVVPREDGVDFDDAAPLAGLRRALTAPARGSPIPRP